MSVGEFLAKWDHFLRNIRLFFYKNGYREIYTPTLVNSPGVDAAIDFWNASWGKETYTLPTSPEISLKKILSLGEEKIFEIKNCFRGDYLSPCHSFEFRMLEWYRTKTSMEELKEETISLIKHVSGVNNILLESVSIPQFFLNIGFEIKPNSTRDDLLNVCKNLNLDFTPSDTWEDLFNRIYLEKIELSFNADAVTIVTDFPPQLASLAKLTNKGWADRFEVYWQGMELANAFNELTDPHENRRRFKLQSDLRTQEGKSAIPTDESFFKMIEKMPPSVGIAMGLERLFMACYKIRDIKIFNEPFK